VMVWGLLGCGAKVDAFFNRRQELVTVKQHN
jgi:hypothetical protein